MALSDADSTEGCACVRTRASLEVSVPFRQFCFKPKTALKMNTNANLKISTEGYLQKLAGGILGADREKRRGFV